MADPLSQIYLQARGGTAGGESFFAPFAAGIQAAQNRQSLAQRRYEFEREQAMRERLAPIQEQSMLLQNKLAQTKYDEVLREQKLRESTLSSYNQLATTIDGLIKSGKAAEPSSWSSVFDILGKDPDLIETPRAQALMHRFDLATKIELQKKELETKTKAQQTVGGLAAPVTDPQGNVLGYERPGATAPHFIAKPKPEEAGGSASTLGKLVADRNFYHKSGNADIASKFDAAIQAEITPKGWSLTTNPDGTVSIAQGPTGSSTPSAMTTRLTERMNQALQGIMDLTEIQQDVRWSDVGPQGMFNTWVFDTVLPTLGVPTANVHRMQFRQKVLATREGLLKDVSDDNRFSLADRAAIEKALPSTGFFSEKGQVQEAAEVTKQMLAKRSVLAALDLKQVPPSWAMDNMTDDQIKALMDKNVITPELLLKTIESGFSKDRAIKIWKARPKG